MLTEKEKEQIYGQMAKLLDTIQSLTENYEHWKIYLKQNSEMASSSGSVFKNEIAYQRYISDRKKVIVEILIKLLL